MASDYATYVYERYQGEVYGEAFFRALAERTPEPSAGAKLRVLEQLERETKERLRAEVVALGLDPCEDPAQRERGEKLAEKLAPVPWVALMNAFLPELRKFAEEYERSEGLAPPGKLDLLRHVTGHERALVRFAELELEGAGDSLATVRVWLRGSAVA